MKNYTVRIRFITKYLQARFTEDAKKELENYISKGIVKTEADSWRVFLYEDDNGIYIPKVQLRNAIVNAGKEFKMKKSRRNMLIWAQSNIDINPDNIYLGKQHPDDIELSYPKRKDGNRVTTRHPVFKEGTEIEFRLCCFDKDMEEKALYNLVEMAGKMYGIGARRADMFGRFEILSFEKAL